MIITADRTSSASRSGTKTAGELSSAGSSRYGFVDLVWLGSFVPTALLTGQTLRGRLLCTCERSADFRILLVDLIYLGAINRIPGDQSNSPRTLNAMIYRRPEIEFAGGVRAGIVGLRQRETYEGLIEGLPTREMNARKLERLREDHPGVHIVHAVQVPIERPGLPPYPFGTPVSLPHVQCVARLYAVEDGIYFRHGVFAWFQEQWAMPIMPVVVDAFLRLNWAEVSELDEI